MQITMSKREVLKCRRIMRHVMTVRTIPALRGIVLESDFGRLDVVATNIDAVVKFHCDDHEVWTTGRYWIPWDRFNALKDETTFDFQDDGTVEIRCHNHRQLFKPDCTAEDFPVFPETQQQINPVMLDLWPGDRVRQFGFCRKVKDGLPEALRHVFLDSRDGTIKLVMTDGTQMVVIDTGIRTDGFTAILPYWLFELQHDLFGGLVIYRPAAEEQFYRVEDPEFTLWFKHPTDLPYPNWRRAIPEKFTHGIDVTVEAWRELGVACSEVLECRKQQEPPSIKFSIEGSDITVRQITQDAILNSFVIHNGDPVETAVLWFQPQHLLHYCAAVSGPVQLLWNDQPSIMSILTTDDKVRYYCMPGQPDPELSKSEEE